MRRATCCTRSLKLRELSTDMFSLDRDLMKSLFKDKLFLLLTDPLESKRSRSLPLSRGDAPSEDIPPLRGDVEEADWDLGDMGVMERSMGDTERSRQRLSQVAK
mmetsp:Transcript_106533/g.254344  ORF Transcript_106533/g.254344 Transcript_106533/m.254344 type:complete len:104 (+) Transcript_106533:1857-2168(+)